MNALLKIVFSTLMFGGMGVAYAQETQEPNQLTQQLVSARIQILRDAGSQEGSDSTLASYEQVLNWLGEAEAHAAAETNYLDMLNTAPNIESEIHARMDAMDYVPSGFKAASVIKLSKSKIEEMLTEFRIKLRDTSTEQENLDSRIATEQSSAPNIQARLEVIDSQIADLPADVITIEPDIQPSQFEAAQWSVIAERKALVAERRSLESRLSSQSVRYSRRKAESEEFTLIIQGLQGAIQTLETERDNRVEDQDAESSISLDENAPGYGFVQQLADENSQLRIQRTDQGALLAALKAENARLAQTQLSLQEQFEAVQQIVDLAQSSASLGHVLMAHWHQADRFRLDVAELASSRDIGEDVIRRAEYEEQVSRLLQTSTEKELDPAADEAVLTAAKDYVRTQRQLLAELIAIETELINVQGSIDRTHQQLDVRYGAYQRYLSSRILWVPSHPAISFSLLKSIRQQFSDLIDSLAGLHITHFTPLTSLLLLLALVTFALRKRMSLHLQSLNTKVGRARDDSIAYTFRALLLTLIRSVPAPLLLFIFASGLEQSNIGAAPYLAKSLIHAAEILFLLLLFRIACEENGIADMHLGWTQSACMDIRRLTTSLLVWWWPLALLTAFLIRVEIESVSAIFGRLAFCLNLAVFGVIFFKIIGSEKQGVNAYQRWRIIGTGIVALIAVFLIACSILGYVYSASIIYTALNKSVFIGAGLVFFYYFMQRWLLVVRRRLRFREILVARQVPDDDREQAAESDEIDLVTLGASVSRLLTAATLALGAFGLVYVWAPLFRALEALQRITLWTVSDVAEGEAILTSITLASLLMALLIGVVTIIAARNLPQLISLLLRSKKGSTPGSRYAISKLLGYLVIGAGFIAILSILGLRWDRLQWLVAALGVGIGFGLQEIIANFISGLLILFEKPIRVGDVVTVGESSGTVIRIQIRATTIRDFDGKELLVPNKEFVTGRLLNWTLSNTDIRMSLEVGIAYGSDVRKAVAIMEDVLAKHEMVLDDPEPDVLFREFGSSSLNLVARYFFSDVEQRGYLLSDLHHKFNDAFAEAGIVIAFPQIDVHIDKPQAGLVNGEEPIPGSA